MPVGTSSVTDAVDRLQNAGTLDPVVAAVRRIVRTALPPGRLRDVLHGVRLGHPLHPMLTDIPIGAWTAAAVLDLAPGTDAAASTLIATGCAGYVPTIAAGWADWSELHEQQQRVGLVHAAAGAIAFSCYVASLAARAGRHRTRGRAWSYAGLAFVTIGGYLGGHLTYRQTAGVNHAEGVQHEFPEGWHQLAHLDDLPDGEPVARTIDDVSLLVLRRGSHVDVLANTCSHLGAPLSEGSFRAEGGQGCIVCPWHGSTFQLADGGVVHGPATTPMPVFETAVRDGVVSVRLPGVG